MHQSLFFKLFPPPVFMAMPHAGLDVSDDAIRAVKFERAGRGRRLGLYASLELPEGLIEGGEVRDEAAFTAKLKEFNERYRLSYVKASVPEERSYLFETEVPAEDSASIAQNIEFKLEENVPLPAAEAVFYFDLVPPSGGRPLRASVSVAPRQFVEKRAAFLQSAGMTPVAFEVAPKAAAKAAVPQSGARAEGSKLIVHIMERKIGIYVVSDGVVSFTLTVVRASGPRGGRSGSGQAGEALSVEVDRIYSYWSSHSPGRFIDEIILVGRDAASFAKACVVKDIKPSPSVTVADVWANALGAPGAGTGADSLEYAVAAGLAMDSSFRRTA